MKIYLRNDDDGSEEYKENSPESPTAVLFEHPFQEFPWYYFLIVILTVNGFSMVDLNHFYDQKREFY